MATRRLPSSVAHVTRECARFASGQRCATCPSRASEECPLRDIEDLPAHLLSRTGRIPPACDGVQLQPLAGRVLQVPAGRGMTSSVGLVVGRAHAGVRRCAMRAEAAERRADGPDLEGVVPAMRVELRPAPAAAAVSKAPSITATPAQAVRKAGVSLSSKAGRAMFQQALVAESAQAYFRLAEQMVYQEEQAMRPVTCLAVVLNALEHDPQKTWRPIWRWNTEEVLLCEETGPCGLSADTIRSRGGLELHEMAELARNNGARAQAFPAVPALPSTELSLLTRPCGETAFRSRVQAVCARSAAADEHLIVRMLSSAGQWKFAPVAGYHASSDSVLLLDLDRAAAPRWIDVSSVWESMCALSGGKAGGYVAVGTMLSEHSAQVASAHALVSSCPRLVRSWAEGQVVESAGLKALHAFEGVADGRSSPTTVDVSAEMCPLGSWAGIQDNPNGGNRVSHSRLRQGCAVKSASLTRQSSRPNEAQLEKTLGLLGVLTSMSVVAQGVQGRAITGGSRFVQSSSVDHNSAAAEGTDK